MPAEHQAHAWNIAGAVARLLLLGTVLWHLGGIALVVGAWWAAEEILVIGCSALYIARPWPIPEGQAQCSALLGYDLGSLGIAIATLIGWQAVKSYRWQDDEDS